MIFETLRDVALCSAITVGLVAFCVLARLAGWGGSP